MFFVDHLSAALVDSRWYENNYATEFNPLETSDLFIVHRLDNVRESLNTLADRRSSNKMTKNKDFFFKEM
jgi:hypothetical protein